MSLVSLMTANSAPHAPPAFGDLGGSLASIRTDDAKLIWNLRTNKAEFYDLKRDPGERQVLSRDEENVMRALREKLERWRASITGESRDTMNLGDEEKADLKSLGYLE